MTNSTFLFETFLRCRRVATDTRTIAPGAIFFALKGENFNGNQFANEALEKGAVLAVVDEEKYASHEKCLLVEDTLSTLQVLAREYRETLEIPFIVIGGSNGKTTTKELITAVLGIQYNTFATKGNLNNHIGVPLTILSIPEQTEVAVIEMGANHIGEYAHLCEIALPTHGVVTNIGLDHLEGFGSLEGVAQANGELYDFLYESQGTVFVNSQEDYLKKLTERFEQVITYPSAGDYYQANVTKHSPYLQLTTEKGEVIDTHLFGMYNFANATTALCIAKYFGVSSEKANEAVAGYQPQNNRSQIIHKESNTLILDAYNANPSSMMRAIESFAAIEASHRVVILGDMYELGIHTDIEHKKLGELVAAQSFDLVVFYGEHIIAALLDNPKAYYFPDKFSLHNWLKDKKLEGAHVLIKGSRGAALETVVDFI
ncbi:MAG: UDP-N-acetylmuramoyl-tripeptide--D-alanyl-D-alanine ligase [Thermonemataceae bacterium]